uniref:RNase H type-1 domain-containing protein n=1 Tax=Cannabis sativa TaxID=3483 RepID=A0A803Q2A2_CANSA
MEPSATDDNTHMEPPHEGDIAGGAVADNDAQANEARDSQKMIQATWMKCDWLTKDQLVEKPHEEICKSRVPHRHPEPTYVTWPTDKTLKDVVNELVDAKEGPAQTIVTHDTTIFSDMGQTFSGSKKRKACLSIIPVITPDVNIINVGNKLGSSSTSLLPTLDVNTFTPRSGRGGVPYHAPDLAMKIISWNCRGIRRTPVTQALQAWVKIHRPECVFLMETKANEEEGNAIEKSIGFPNSVTIPAEGMAGGFTLLWNQDINLKQGMGKLHGISISRSSPTISHLMFVDDTIIFARANKNNVMQFWKVSILMKRGQTSSCDLQGNGQPNQKVLVDGGPDSLVWKPAKDGSFSVKEAYKAITSVHGHNTDQRLWRELTAQFFIFLGYLFESVWKARNEAIFKDSWKWYAKSEKTASAPEAELMAIYWALQLDKELGHDSIVVLSDAQIMVKALEDKRFPPVWETRPLAFSVLNTCNSFSFCHFCYIPRLDNSTADFIAKKARTDDGYSVGHCIREGSPVVMPNFLLQ